EKPEQTGDGIGGGSTRPQGRRNLAAGAQYRDQQRGYGEAQDPHRGHLGEPPPATLPCGCWLFGTAFMSSLRAGVADRGASPASERTKAAICQIWSSGILPRNEGMPLGRPSRMLAAMFSMLLP